MVNKLRKVYPDLKGKKIAIWGIAFKPRTDDIREAPSIDIIKSLLDMGAEVSAFDPVAQKNVEAIYPGIIYGDDPYDILKDCDAIMLMTEWNMFRDLDFAKVKQLMKKPVIIDGRNVYEKEDIGINGFIYESFGR